MVVAKTDAAVKRGVEAALHGNLRLDPRNLSVEVSHGTVRLLGSVPNYYQKREAVATASQAPGVAGVVDEVTVGPEGRLSDHQVKYHVQQALIRDRRVDEKEVSVEVRQGVVTLTGLVESPARKHFAEEDLWPLPGVAEIDDRMAVGPIPSRPDREISRDVAESLRANPWIDSSRVVVAARDRVVSLAGSVPTREQKRLAEDAGWWVPGVRDVRNDVAVGA